MSSVPVSANGTGRKKPKVALVRGPIVSKLGVVHHNVTPSVALAYVAGHARSHGYDCVIVDAIGEGIGRTWQLEKYPEYQAEGLNSQEVITLIPPDTEVIGFTAMFSGEWPVVRDLIIDVREHFPDAVFVAGGEHASALSEYSLRDCPALDFIVKGEGDVTFTTLLDAIAETTPYEEIGGLAWIDGQDTYHEPSGTPRIRKGVELQRPYWPEGYLELFWSTGNSYGPTTSRDMPMMISRGCPFRCTFCSSESMWTTRYVMRDVDDVVDELKGHIAKYRISGVQLYDLTAITKKRWIMAFAEQLKREGIQLAWSFPSGTRSEALDEESLAAIRDMGCHYLVFAPESGSPRTLELIKKRIHLPRITEAMAVARKLGINMRANLIIGFPHETRKDVYKTLLYGLKLAAIGVNDVPLFIFSPYPGTEIFKGLVDRGSIEINDDYFFLLTSLNSDFASTKTPIHNDNVYRMELVLCRVFFMMLYIAVGYLLFPKRIYYTFRNVFGKDNKTQTVLEQRLRASLKFKMATKR